MANEEQLALLKSGVEKWNHWRIRNPLTNIQLAGADLRQEILFRDDLTWADLLGIDLTGADLRGANLEGVVLTEAHLGGADLSGATLTAASLAHARLGLTNLRDALLNHANLGLCDLRGTDLTSADLSNANLSRACLVSGILVSANLNSADLSGADLRASNLSLANLVEADLRGANLSAATLVGANFENSKLQETVFANVDLTEAIGLNAVSHYAPTILDHRTLQRSRGLPLAFLRGCGLPDDLINNLSSVFPDGQPIQFYSCFISYSASDQEFAERLHSDLQNKGVRCWFAPHDLKIGDRFRQRIDEAIRVHDRLLLILSEHSVESAWVREEVEACLERERREKREVLFPIQLDDAVNNTNQAWAASIRRQCHIGDFTKWKDHDSYMKAFDRLLRDLKQEKA